MNDWPDEKVYSTALRYIRHHAMEPAAWRYTRIGDAAPEVPDRASLQRSEKPLVSFFLSDASWHLLTTRRVLGAFAGQQWEAPALDVLRDEFGDFKGYRGEELGIMELSLKSGRVVTLQYETGRASMAPIYYFRYWHVKYPVLDKLKT